MHGFGPARRFNPPTDGLKKPDSLKEVPVYVFRRIKGFLSRLFYIIGLVWQTAPAILIVMTLFCVLEGLLPVVGVYISSELLNGIADLLGKNTSGSLTYDLFTTLRPVIFLFVLYFSYQFLSKIITRISAMVTGIAGELVTNHIKMKIITKAKTVDLRSFDRPEFYEKLENANREAIRTL